MARQVLLCRQRISLAKSGSKITSSKTFSILAPCEPLTKIKSPSCIISCNFFPAETGSAKEKIFSVSTKVTFDTLSEEEIIYYVDKFKPYDKAGAYGIQEWIGIAACSHIEGSYSNVVGLPVQRLYKELQNFIL